MIIHSTNSSHTHIEQTFYGNISSKYTTQGLKLKKKKKSESYTFTYIFVIGPSLLKEPFHKWENLREV